MIKSQPAKSVPKKSQTQINWYKCSISSKELRSYMKRQDLLPLLWLAGHFGLILAAGVLAYLSFGEWYFWPIFFVYATAYSFLECLMHESQHGATFRTRWINEVVYYICCFAAVQEPTTNRWVHTEHHTHTSIRGADHEFQTGRPPQLWHILTEVFRIPVVIDGWIKMIRHAVGRPTDTLRSTVRDDNQFGKMRVVSILYLLAYLGIFIWAILAQSWLPILFTFGARIIGGPLVWVVFFTEHPGLEEDVYDHRRNSRTVYTNRVMRFLSWNMNYHIEHHMYPMVPFHQLPDLHERIKDELPNSEPSYTIALFKTLRAVLRQMRDAEYFDRPRLPKSSS
ncbi:fatty acid desaturase (plasmid) [Pseudohalocynthiibacter aestuariivivens]|nr:fatty acid desaturase [Pseudohalocynthiibacter aestuariivivens]QIE48190.1 fatty acid desaturase [Pseudohalocynthiibacter aestuariivivens]